LDSRFPELDSLYRDIVLDHFRTPRGRKAIPAPDVENTGLNPLCGDEVSMQIRVGSNSRIEEIRFTGKGCAISLASASMLTELAKGKELEWVKQVSKEDVLKMLGNPDLGPSRIKCALLGMKVLKTGVYGYLGSRYVESEGSGAVR